MQITLDIVRQTLRRALGSDSFIASFINEVKESPDIPTASINAQGMLRYNPEFVEKLIATREDLFSLVMHEIMHPMFGHFIYNNGRLENIAADMVINATISRLFCNASGDGALFKKAYAPQGVEGLLRPQSQMHQSRYSRLYDAFYATGYCCGAPLSTGEVIQALKVLTPAADASSVMLMGSHTGKGENQQSPACPDSFPAETLCKIAEDLRKHIPRAHGRNAGYGENLYALILEAIKTHLSIRKVLLQKFVTRRKLDHFKQSIHRPAIGVSPIPLHPSKRDFVLLAAGIPPFHYHNHVSRVATKDHGLAVYLDVSGSVNDHLPQIVGVLSSLKAELTSIFLFSNKVVEVPFKTLLAGHVQTTYGTDFDCIADSILERAFDKAIVLTDGFASLKKEKQKELINKKTQILTILFGGKTVCDEFAPIGDVVQLEDITE